MWMERSGRAVRAAWAPAALVLTCWAASACGGPTGQRLFRYGGCAQCHGTHLTGSYLAPSLKGLRRRWTREELEKFLSDPLSYKESDPRLKKLARRYPAPMPMFVMSDADRKHLVDYLMQASGDP